MPLDRAAMHDASYAAARDAMASYNSMLGTITSTYGIKIPLPTIVRASAVDIPFRCDHSLSRRTENYLQWSLHA